MMMINNHFAPPNLACLNFSFSVCLASRGFLMADLSGDGVLLFGVALVATLAYEWNSRYTLFSNLKMTLRFFSPLASSLSAASLFI